MAWYNIFWPFPPDPPPEPKLGETRRVIREEDISRFHRSDALRLFAMINFAVALFYSGLATWGILDIMLFQASVSERVEFSDMIALLERSLYHSLAAGLAFAVDYVMTQIREIFDDRRREQGDHDEPSGN